MPKRKRDFRWVKWLSFLVLVVAAIVVVILVKNNYFNEKSGDNPQQSENANRPEDKEPEVNSNSDRIEENKTEEEKPEEKVPQYDGESPNKSETLTGMITYANVADEELTIRVNIDQFLQTGTCNIVMSRNGITYYTGSVGIIESVTTSTCDGFKIPVSELVSGNLQVEINLESEGKSGKIEGRVKI